MPIARRCVQAWLAALLSAVLLVSPAPRHQAEAQTAPLGMPIAGPINSVVFARRPPPPGRLAYLSAIRFIDDGMKYADPFSGFLVSPAGELCFLTHPGSPQSIYEDYYAYWCASVPAIGRVEVLPGSGGSPGEVRLWCRHAFPQCAHRLGWPVPFGRRPRIADSISARTVADRRERDALQDLIFVMGGVVAPADLSGRMMAY